MPAKKVCVVGSGNWGSAIAKIIGENVKASNRFQPLVNMWVYEENISGRKLTEIINTEHENVKYLPGHKLPKNVIAVADVTEAVTGADFLVFVIPHQFIRKLCDQMKPHIKPGAIGISLIKGIDESPTGLTLISDIIREKLDIDISVLMGANIASEVADNNFCETTIGACNERNGLLFKELMQTPNFRITVVSDSNTVELCGALKNIVAIGAGFCDGLGFGDNTKAASCGIADLITTCYGGRNRRIAEAFVTSNKSIAELEAEMLNGQKLQGPQTSAEVYKILEKKSMVNKFPLFVSVYQVCFEGKDVKCFISCLQNHPQHM
uniref:Glycerol-3-phosphate dehydrogenase [NAD(+)] n=1 Tax=Electrophorus electricus TaxID=8005 RepID=A0A4W4F1J9_ELEEL